MKTKHIYLVILMLLAYSYTQAQGKNCKKDAIEESQAFEEREAVTAETIITDSKKKKGYKNLSFKLSNGMTFDYEDGNYKASYNNRSLDVNGKYSMRCEIGTLSIAFNADDGSIWWVFKEHE